MKWEKCQGTRNNLLLIRDIKGMHAPQQAISVATLKTSCIFMYRGTLVSRMWRCKWIVYSKQDTSCLIRYIRYIRHIKCYNDSFDCVLHTKFTVPRVKLAGEKTAWALSKFQNTPTTPPQCFVCLHTNSNLKTTLIGFFGGVILTACFNFSLSI